MIEDNEVYLILYFRFHWVYLLALELYKLFEESLIKTLTSFAIE